MYDNFDTDSFLLFIAHWAHDKTKICLVYTSDLPSLVKENGSSEKTECTTILTLIASCCLSHIGLTIKPRFVFSSVDSYSFFNL